MYVSNASSMSVSSRFLTRQFHNVTLTWLTGSSSMPPALPGLRSSKIFIIISVSTSIFTDTTPGSTQVQYKHGPLFLAIYDIATLIASPFCGYLADMVSSQRLLFILGLLALTGSIVLLFVGKSIGILLAGRVFQGFSAAVVGVVGLALIVDTFGPEAVGEAMGYLGLSMNLAILLGPILGDIVYANTVHDAVFLMAFGLIALDIFL
ncbi:hypothetical protein NHQ30_003213 [Ciborinia camelliae]|nr:hypothetical protein NHQ30_003213 [Ciborinia camelliae]